jgi:hypothetical protein
MRLVWVDREAARREPIGERRQYGLAPALPFRSVSARHRRLPSISRLLSTMTTDFGPGRWWVSLVETETRFYITSLTLLANALGPMIHSHWMVESAPQAHARRRFAMN